MPLPAAYRHADPGVDLSGYLDRGLHSIWYELSGEPAGIPVINLHGGPGAGLYPEDRCLFDPARFRLLQFDQRGCGRSRPLACLDENDTARLVADIDALADHLGFDRFVLTGHSWGTSLAIRYAIHNPARCRHLVLRGLCLLSEAEFAWNNSGWRTIFPDAWAEFSQSVGGADGYIASEALLMSDDVAVAQKAAVAMTRFELSCCFLEPDPAVIDSFLDPELCLATARIGMHYAANGWFLEPHSLLRDFGAVRHIPCTVIQGRYDIVTPIGIAHAFHSAWPEVELICSGVAGHMPSDSGNILALTDLMDRLAPTLGGDMV
jgi:proline iminopeptidase